MVESTLTYLQAARPVTAIDSLRVAYESLQLKPDVTPDGDLLGVDDGIAIINELPQWWITASALGLCDKRETRGPCCVSSSRKWRVR